MTLTVLRALRAGALLAALFATPLLAQGQGSFPHGHVWGQGGFVSFAARPRPVAAWAEDGRALRMAGKTVDPLTFEEVTVKPPVKESEELDRGRKAFEGALKAKGLRVRQVRARPSTVPRAPEGNPGVLREGDGSAALVGGDLWVQRDGERLVRLTRTGKASLKRRIEMAPDGRALSFVDGYDLYLGRTDGTLFRLSDDGSPELFYGELDWVYQEEVYGRYKFKATWWAPNSEHLAFLRIDEEGVPTFNVVDDIPTHPEIEALKYPKAGDTNPRATLHVASAEDGKVRAVDLGRYEGKEILIVRVGWTPDSRVLFQVQDREQTWLDLNVADPKTGAVTHWIREDSETWVNILDGIHWLEDGSFLWESERTGYRHLYHYDAQGKLVRAVTSGEWQVTGVSEIDEKRGEVVFTGTRDGAINKNTYIVRLEGGEPWRVTPGPGTHSVEWNGDGSLALVRSNALNNPGEQRLVRRDGKVLRILARSPMPKAAERYGYSMPELVSIPCRDGYRLDATILKPENFDPALAWPVWIDTYSGPDAPSVRNAWESSGWFQFLAQEGYIVFQLNVRSASGRGQKHTQACYQRMGIPETEDIEDAVKWLTAHPWADASRVGITGWSYGGFIAARALCCTKLFKLGIAGGGVYTWRNYDTIYTERYMRTPQNNPEGYENGSVLKWAKNLHGHLVIIHGAIDDNVHVQNAMQLAYELQKAGKIFDLMIYPRNRHGIRNRSQFWHWRDYVWHQIQEHLPAGGRSPASGEGEKAEPAGANGR